MNEQLKIIIIYGTLGVLSAALVYLIFSFILTKIKTKLQLNRLKTTKTIKLHEHELWRRRFHRSFTGILND